MYDTLRSDVHIRTGSHLSVLSYAHSIETFPIIRFRIVWYHHTICNYYAGSIFVRWIQSHRITRVHYKSLFFCHFRQVLHRQTILSPVLEHSTISTVGDKFVRVLSNSRVQVVLNHKHNSCCLTTFGRIFLYGTCIHFVCRTETIHVYTSIFSKLFGKFGSQYTMKFWVKITQSVANSQFFFSFSQNIFAFWSMIYTIIPRLWFGQYRRYTLAKFLLKFS